MGAGPSIPEATAPHSGRPEESILVHGEDDIAVSAVAVGFARRAAGSFAWVDFEIPKDGTMSSARLWIEDRSGQPMVETVEPSLLRPSNRDRLALRRLVTPESNLENTRLQNHLALPELFQRLAARALTPAGHGVVLLANVDCLPRDLRVNTVETRWIHETLHEEGLSVIATSRAPPSEGLSRAVDRVLRVEVPEGGALADGLITEEKLGAGPGASRPLGLRTVWDQMGLDPGLLSR